METVTNLQHLLDECSEQRPFTISYACVVRVTVLQRVRDMHSTNLSHLSEMIFPSYYVIWMRKEGTRNAKQNLNAPTHIICKSYFNLTIVS